MTRNRILLAGAGGFIIVVLIAAWALGFFSDTPEEASIEATAEAAAAAAEDSSTTADASAGETDGPEAAGLDGVWTVQQNAEATFIGYRINEVLNSIGDFEVVGRTSDVAGMIELTGTTIDEVSVVAQMGSLTTDSGARDQAMRSQALETSEFPEATFTLTEAIDLGSIPAEGETITVTAVGDLTIHGVTQTVDFPLEAQIVGEAIAVVGQLRIQLADYDIDAPSAPIVASVEDNALLELSLIFNR